MRTNLIRFILHPFSRHSLAAVIVMTLASTAPAEELRLLIWEGYAPQPMVEKFEKEMTAKHGVAVKVSQSYAKSGDDFFVALRDNTADVVSPSHNVPRNKKFPLFPLALPLDLTKLPNYAKLSPSLQKLDFHTDKDVVYLVPLLFGPYGLVYHSGKVTPPPASWKILLDNPGEYVLCDDYPEINIYVAALISGVAKEDLGNFDKINTPAVIENLKKLVAGAKRLWSGVDKADDFKDVKLGGSWGFALPELNKRGEPWMPAFPSEGTTAYIDGFMINKKAESNPKLKAIAEDWVNFSISEEMQLGYMREIGAYPASTLVKASATPAEVARYSLNDSDFFKKSFALWPVLDERASNGYKRLWENAKKK